MLPEPSSLPQSLVTLEYLTTLPGLVIMTYLITYFLKYPLKALFKTVWKKNPPKIFVPFVAAFIAFGINMWVLLVLNIISIETVGLAIFNAFVAAFLAFVSHDFISGPTKEKADQKTIKVEQAQLDLIMENKDLATKLAAAQKTGDRSSGDEPPSSIQIPKL